MKKLSIVMLALALVVVFTLPAMAVDEDFIRLSDKMVKLDALNDKLEADIVDIGNDNLAIGLAGGAFIGMGGVGTVVVAIGSAISSINPVIGLIALSVWLIEKHYYEDDTLDAWLFKKSE